MADENSFVQEVKFKVDDSELRSAVDNMRKNFGDGKNSKVTSSLEKGFKDAGKEAQKTAKEAERIGKATKVAARETNGLASAFDRMKGAVTGLVAAYAGFRGISALVGFGRGSIDAFNIQNRAERMLEFGMRQNGTAARAQELKDYASGIQRRSMYGDEALLTAAGAWQNKIRGVDNSKRMMELVADFAAKSTGGGTVDAGAMRGMAQQLMQALSGRAITLKAQGFDITAINDLQKIRQNGGVVTEDMEIAALEKVLAPIRGMARELSETDEGKIIQLKNEIGDMREEIGRELLPVVARLAGNLRDNLPVVKELFEGFSGVLVGWMNSISEHRETIVSFVSSMGEIVTFIAKNVGFVINFKASMMLLGPLFKKTALQMTQAEMQVETSTQQAASGISKAAVQIRNAGEQAQQAGQKLSGVGTALGALRGFAVNAIVAWSASQIEEAISAAWSYFKERKRAIDFDTAQGERRQAQDRMLNAWNAYKNGGALKDINERRDLEAAVQSYRAKYGTDAAVPEYIRKALGEDTSVKPDLSSEKKGTKGATTNNFINYTNNITTDSDLMAKAIKENLRTLLTSQLTFVSRSETARALAL